MNKNQVWANNQRSEIAMQLCCSIQILRNLGDVLPWTPRALRRKYAAVRRLADSIINEGYREYAITSIDFTGRESPSASATG